MLPASIGNIVTKLFMLSLGLILFIPSAYKLYDYFAFRYQAMTVYGMVIDPSKGKDLGGRPVIQ
jgi:hypothetical protein